MENKYQEALEDLGSITILVEPLFEGDKDSEFSVAYRYKEEYDTLQELIDNYSKLEKEYGLLKLEYETLKKDYQELKQAFNDVIYEEEKK